MCFLQQSANSCFWQMPELFLDEWKTSSSICPPVCQTNMSNKIKLRVRWLTGWQAGRVLMRNTKRLETDEVPRNSFNQSPDFHTGELLFFTLLYTTCMLFFRHSLYNMHDVKFKLMHMFLFVGSFICCKLIFLKQI